MRTSRVAKEASKLFSAGAAGATEFTLPRRSTRSSLARFSYNANAADANATTSTTTLRDDDPDEDDGNPGLTFGSDIEDAVKSTRPVRKRKRAAAVGTHSSSPPAKIKAEEEAVKFEPESESESESEVDVKPKAKAKARARAQPRRVRKPTGTAAKVTAQVQPPPGWEEMYAVTKAMRLTGAAANAAVDTMGCERLAAPGASARDRRFHTLVALMLSSQTKDTVNAEAMARLQTEMPAHAPGAPPGLNLENMLAVDPAVLNEMIGKVGFHNNKTRYHTLSLPAHMTNIRE